MQSTKYRAELQACLQQMQQEDEGGEERSRLLQNLARCMREEVTSNQRMMLTLYYGEKMKQPQIAARMGVNKSTVCRTLKRGEQKLKRCLRYGAQRFLMSLGHKKERSFDMNRTNKQEYREEVFE